MQYWIEFCFVLMVVRFGIVSVVVVELGVYRVIVNRYIEMLEIVFGVLFFYCYVCGYSLIEIGQDMLEIVNCVDEMFVYLEGWSCGKVGQIFGKLIIIGLLGIVFLVMLVLVVF